MRWHRDGDIKAKVTDLNEVNEYIFYVYFIYILTQKEYMHIYVC